MNDDSRKFFDVAPPGRAQPSPNSRPVIANPNPQARDLMFQDDTAAVSAPLPQPTPPMPAPTEPAAQPVPPQPEPLPQPAPTPQAVQPVDPASLLIQAGNFVPPKPSRRHGHQAVLITMLAFLVVAAAVSYLLVSSM